MLAELKRVGVTLEIDKRDPVAEGIENIRSFLETTSYVEPEFRAFLSQGVERLRRTEAQ